MENQKVGVKELAEILGITPRRVQQLVDEQIFERDSRGTYDLASNVRAYCAYLGSRETPASTALDTERTKAVALQNAVREAKLVPYDLAEALMAEILGVIRTEESALPVLIAKSRIDRAEIERITRIVEDMQRRTVIGIRKIQERFNREISTKTTKPE